MKEENKILNNVKSIIDSYNRPVKTAEFIDLGVTRKQLSILENNGLIERVGHGFYRLSEYEQRSQFADWAVLSLRYPNMIICLNSAAAFHKMTQNMASVITVAVPKENGRSLEGNSFPAKVKVCNWKNGPLFEIGVDIYNIDGVDVRITSQERTIVDMFRMSSYSSKYKNKLPIIDEETFQDCFQTTLSKLHNEINLDKIIEISSILDTKNEFLNYIKLAVNLNNSTSMKI